MRALRINNARMNLAGRYAGLLKSVFNDTLVSVFLFGSVGRGEDTVTSDVDLMVILKKPPTIRQVGKLGKTGRFNEIRGRGEFHDISCAVVSQDSFLKLAREGAPREAVNPLREAVVLYDTDFVSELMKELRTGTISLKKDAYRDYLRYGDIRRSCLDESEGNRNKRDARSDASKAATHYLRAYFLYKYDEMILSVKELRKRMKGENRAMAMLYEKIMEGDYDMDFVDAIREWVVGRIGVAEEKQNFIY